MASNKMSQRLASVSAQNRSRSVIHQKNNSLTEIRKPPVIISSQSDRRNGERQSSYKFVSVSYGADLRVSGIVNDITPMGICITLEFVAPFPNEVEVHIPSLGIRRNAGNIWQKGQRIGLEFTW